MKNKLMKKKNFSNIRQSINQLKSTGVGISHKEIYKDMKRSNIENMDLLYEAQREQSVIRMKRFYERRGWVFPPRSLPNLTMVHLINGYYGKELVKHTPKDELEKKLGV